MWPPALGSTRTGRASTSTTTPRLIGWPPGPPRPDGRWAYVLGCTSPFVPFDVHALLRTLNEAEGAGKARWGGSDLVGGSPRVRGSKLSPREVERIINGLLGTTPRRTRRRGALTERLATPGAVAFP